MKNLYMVQASNTYTGNSFKAAYLPYAVGLLVAYAFSDEKIKSEYAFKRFVFIREDTDSVVSCMDNPAFVGFSNYIWNTQYNLTLARKIKEKYPDCIILFGGHNVPPDNSFLEKYPFIDFLIHGEGEEAFRSLLLALIEKNPDFSHIPNLSWRYDGKCFMNPTEVLTKTDYPSPYLEGYFDYIFTEYPDYQLDAILETSRGCPRDCAYCDWGCNSQRIKLFPIERVYAEIDWFAAHNVKFIWGADANFGAYDRDMDIVDYLVKTRQETGCPERIRINYSMTRHKEVFEISRKLEKYGLSKEGATLSFQSLNPETLEAIGRKNMSLDKFTGLIGLYKKEGVTTYSELITGLPCETYESFCKGIGLLLAAGQHRLITAYNCEILPNAPMAEPTYMEKYGIKVVTVENQIAHTKNEAEIKEKTSYIIETNTLPREDWIKCNIFACFEESYHHHGILKFISMYLFDKKDIPYEVFYNRIVDFAKENADTVLRSVYEKLYAYFESVSLGKPLELYANKIYGDVTWIPKKMPHLDTIYRIDEFYEELKDVLRGYSLEEKIIDELIKYEKTALKYPSKNNFSVDFDYNWHEYFTAFNEGDRIPLVHVKNRVTVANEFIADNWKDYAIQSTWFGKNGSTFNQGVTMENI